jgi:hypothetical protein
MGAVIGARLSVLDALCVCYEPATEDERAVLACLDCRISACSSSRRAIRRGQVGPEEWSASQRPDDSRDS